MTTKITIVIILIFGVLLFSQEQDTTYKKPVEKEIKAKKYDDIEQKLWEQNRQMDKLNKKDTIKGNNE